jgi:hypothetical protein
MTDTILDENDHVLCPTCGDAHVKRTSVAVDADAVVISFRCEQCPEDRSPRLRLAHDRRRTHVAWIST